MLTELFRLVVTYEHRYPSPGPTPNAWWVCMQEGEHSVQTIHTYKAQLIEGVLSQPTHVLYDPVR
jgi:hypothetical protein